MPELKAERAIAEKFLKEMLKADDTGNYELFIKHYEREDLIDFSPERFEQDIKQMHARNGKHMGYEYFGTLKGYHNGNYDNCYRFVWKGIYEKREALITIGIHYKDGTWYINESSVR
ncbi:hypothetical protein EBI01_17625 [Marinomonas rhizomae]|uniref:SnoaL-like protein n=1 Tax=Marinomonas rhizomae TaxID=491948 RepID=A0A366IX63_9GAMM|nr:hypothetical protein [Marinomonas rhizomae]RBP79157.1 hypothetical protein DFP80_11590 [Marinomonas rhizomae]RNF70449.1 hypothetical protein EBI01_17625 [Marinomonas rhizomae]